MDGFNTWIDDEEFYEALNGPKNWIKKAQGDPNFSLPNMPSGVRQDIGNTNVLPHLARTIDQTSPHGRDALSQFQKARGMIAPTRDGTIDPGDQTDYEWMKGLVWGYNGDKNLTEIVEVTPLDFDTKTLRIMVGRRFGFKEYGVRADKARTAFQHKVQQVVPGEEDNPVIMLDTASGLYLWEGWHRTMNRLIAGATPAALAALKDESRFGKEFDDEVAKTLQLSQWTKVKIQTYIGRPAGQASHFATQPGQRGSGKIYRDKMKQLKGQHPPAARPAVAPTPTPPPRDPMTRAEIAKRVETLKYQREINRLTTAPKDPAMPETRPFEYPPTASALAASTRRNASLPQTHPYEER